MTSLCEAAVEVLTTADPARKTALTLEHARRWQAGEITEIGRAAPPDRPARPHKPEILPPNKMPRRGTGADAGKIALFHALAHIEFNAIDLGWDIIARFADPALPKAFYDDWVQVAKDEAEHFEALEHLLNRLGSHYGALPAHDGLWQAAEKTAASLAHRLAIVPMTLEARALDTAPHSIAKLAGSADAETLRELTKIVEEEVDHVAAGTRWFLHLCAQDGTDPASRYQAYVRDYFPYGLKKPFNYEGRDRTGLPRAFYEVLGN